MRCYWFVQVILESAAIRSAPSTRRSSPLDVGELTQAQRTEHRHTFTVDINLEPTQHRQQASARPSRVVYDVIAEPGMDDASFTADDFRAPSGSHSRSVSPSVPSWFNPGSSMASVASSLKGSSGIVQTPVDATNAHPGSGSARVRFDPNPYDYPQRGDPASSTRVFTFEDDPEASPSVPVFTSTASLQQRTPYRISQQIQTDSTGLDSPPAMMPSAGVVNRVDEEVQTGSEGDPTQPLLADIQFLRSLVDTYARSVTQRLFICIHNWLLMDGRVLCDSQEGKKVPGSSFACWWVFVFISPTFSCSSNNCHVFLLVCFLWNRTAAEVNRAQQLFRAENGAGTLVEEKVGLSNHLGLLCTVTKVPLPSQSDSGEDATVLMDKVQERLSSYERAERSSRKRLERLELELAKYSLQRPRCYSTACSLLRVCLILMREHCEQV